MTQSRTIILGLILSLHLNLIFAQFPGKKSKNDFTAIDSTTFRVGDIVSFGQPIKGETYASISSFEQKTFLDNVNDVTNVLAGNEIKNTKFNLSSKELRNKKDARIKFFKILKNKAGELTNYAIVPYNKKIHLAIPINIALSIGELVSKNPNYISDIKLNTTSHIKSFSSDFDIKLLSVKGDSNNQTVAIELLTKHAIVHQEICLNYGKNDAKLYDYEGNEYLAKDVKIGALDTKNQFRFGNYVCNKIPTNVPVKCKIVFKQVLPDKSKMSFLTIKVGYKAFDGGSYEYGTIELTDLKVDWK